MFTIEIGPPDNSNLCLAFNNLLSEATRKNLSGVNFQNHVVKWAKSKYGYDMKFTVNNGMLVCHIDENEAFFILKHG